MIALSVPRRYLLVFPQPFTGSIVVLVGLLVVLLVMGGRWWYATRDDPVRRGDPDGRVIPDPEWKEPFPPDVPAGLGGGGTEPHA